MTWLVQLMLLAIMLAVATQPTGAETPAHRDVTYEQVHAALEDAGYEVGGATTWGQDVLTFRVAGGLRNEPIRWVFMYPSAAAAVAAHQSAAFDEHQQLNRDKVDGDHRGPQLLSGYGVSSWWRNLAIVQHASPGDLAAWPSEPDCGESIVRTSASPLHASSSDAIPQTEVSWEFIDLLEASMP